MKILIVVSPLANRGGIIRRLRLWSKYFSRSYQVKILCSTCDDSIPLVFEKEGVVIKNSPFLGKNGRVLIIPGMLAIKSEIDEYKPDVVISMFLWSDFLTSLALRIIKKQHCSSIIHLVHIAGNPVPPWSNSIKKYIHNKLFGFALRSCSRLIPICQNDADFIKKKFSLSESKICIIPIGIDPPGIQKKNTLHNPFVFGIVSRLSREKNISSIIDCFCRVLKNSKEQVELHIYGDGQEYSSLMGIVNKLHIQNFVFFKGHVADPYSAFDSIDCLLLFSLTEGTPRSILEAGARGVPTISGDVGGVSEIIQHGQTGYLVNDKNELCQRMSQVIQEKEHLLQMGRNATDFVAANRLIENEIIQIENLFTGH